jgi:glutamyl-tRNA synthetase
VCYRGRFAPSPTGWLHLGNARTALIAWWRARRKYGKLIVRIDDLDGPRTVPETVFGNLIELRWLGIDWDEGPDVGGPFAPYRQSERFDSYETALELLRAKGSTFSCFLSRKELRALSSAPHGRPTVYGQAERKANNIAARAKGRLGKRPSTRFHVSESSVEFVDVLAGRKSASVVESVGDIIVYRADGAWAYHFATVLDDAAMCISEVVRGDDLLDSTPTQVVLYRAFGAVPPQFAHVPMLHTHEGKRMAKRTGSLTLRALRQAGVSADRVVGLLCFSLGLVRKPIALSATEALAHFDIEQIRRQPFRLLESHLAWLRNV